MIRFRDVDFQHFSWFLAAFLTAAAALIFMAGRVQAQTPRAVTDDDVNRIASQLYCPVCQNIPLDVCPTTACSRWRADIRSKLEAGWSDKAVQDYFIEQFGARVIGTPPRSGFNWLLYAVAPGGALALAIAAFFVLRHKPARQSNAHEADGFSTDETDSWREKLERDVQKDDRA